MCILISRIIPIYTYQKSDIINQVLFTMFKINELYQ